MQRQQYEGAVCHARMRYFERAVTDCFGTEDQQIQVERARRIAKGSFASETTFNPLQLGSQLVRIESGVELYGGVDEVIARRINWRAAVGQFYMPREDAGQLRQQINGVYPVTNFPQPPRDWQEKGYEDGLFG